MDSMLNKQLLVLGALLHDVGKFAQRAGAKASTDLEQEYCPQGKTHRHVLYTDYFIEHELPLPEEITGHRSTLARIASAHHRPSADSLLEQCICYADRLSSGGDRLEGDSEGDYRSARMESIFSAITYSASNTSQKAPLRYALQALDIANSFPIFPITDEVAKSHSYADLYKEFLLAIKAAPTDMGVVHFTHSIATICERFTWCIPSSTYHTRADISLYDHAITTAAISQALYAYSSSTHNEHLQSAQFLLFGGDVSGIQKYIFGEDGTSSKGSSKLLRARSLLVQLFTKSIWLTLLSRLELLSVAKIMDAGGRFILLLPSTEKTYTAIQSLKEEVQNYTMTYFQGTLRMHFASLEIQAEDLHMQTFQERFETFNDILENAKLKPYATYFQAGNSAVLPMDRAQYAEHGECVACRMQPAAEYHLETATAPENEEKLCKQCYNLITQVGKRLPQARYIILAKHNEGYGLFGGLRAYLKENTPQKEHIAALDILSIRDRQAFTAAPIAGYVPRITEEDWERWQGEGRLHSKDADAYTFAGEDISAHSYKGEIKTFAMLAEESRIMDGKNPGRSIPCLAACKADVDNLGMLFGVGFGVGAKSRFSISRFSMLSRMLHHFFASHLMQRIEQEFPNIYVIFAGGDDLFVLGPWSDILRFSLLLHDDFTRFSGGHPHVTLSAGLPLIKAKLPVTDMKEVAEEALETAKKHPHKNAVHVFGQTCTWDDFAELMERGEWLEKLCMQDLVTQGFVRRMLGYARELQAFRNGDIGKGLCLSHYVYDRERNCKTNDMQAEDKKQLQSLMDNHALFSQMEVSISWALYRTRKV